jgi:hypothetical protein
LNFGDLKIQVSFQTLGGERISSIVFLYGMLLFRQMVKPFWLNSVSEVTIPQMNIIRHAKSMKRSCTPYKNDQWLFLKLGTHRLQPNTTKSS